MQNGKTGSGLISFVSEALDDIYSADVPDLKQEEFIKEICGTIFMGKLEYPTFVNQAVGLMTPILSKGTVGTTSGVINVFMLAMVHHLEIQRRAQVELESVLRGPDGKLRLPTHDDEPLLPYCTAIVKETLRYSILCCHLERGLY